MKLSLGLTPRDYSVAGGVTYDADAQAYFTANTAITSSADKNAINTFYLGLKSDGIYTKIKAMYLPIWGSASASKWNLVNPVDTNAAFRLTFTTGWTFNSGGMTPNGTSAYARTYFTPSSVLTTNDCHISHYSRTDNNTLSCDIGSQGMGSTNSLSLYATSTYNMYRISDFTFSTITTTNSKNFKLGSRLSSTTKKMSINGVTTDTAVTSLGLPNQSVLISAYQDNGAINYYSVRQTSFASIGTGLTDTEATNFYNRVNTLMTYFGINV